MNKKIYHFFITCLIATNFCFAQNLVLNGGFENITSCPNAEGQLNNASSWGSARGTCDLFNDCNSGNLSVPNNIIGFQYAHSGNGYAGFFASQGWTEVREYLQIQLSTPLEQGVEYCVKFYLCLGDKLNSFGEETFDLAVNNIGAYFSTTQYIPDENNFSHIEVTPQIINDPNNQLLTDTLNWMLIEGQFIATGGEQFMLIGSFNDEAGQNTTGLGPWLGDNKWSYYLIDDVQVKKCSCPEINFNTNITEISCHNDTNASINSMINGGVSPFTFNLIQNGSVIQTISTIQNNVSFNNLAAGTYTIQVIDSNLCEADTILILGNPFSITANAIINDATCEQNNGSISVIASGGSGTLSYNWQLNNGTNTFLNNISEGNYILQITDTNGCVLDTSFSINTTLKPDALINYTPLTISVNTSVTFSDNSIPNSGILESYYWSFSNGMESILPQVNTSFSSAGIYELLYIVGNSEGCFDTLNLTIPISGDLTIPNVITINNDGLNDYFILNGIQNFKRVELTVMNRWGEVIFKDNDYGNDWKPTNLTEGVYFYHLELISFNELKETKQGFIELIK